MADLNIGDEVYLVDIVFRRCKVINNPITLNKDLMTLDLEEANISYRFIDDNPKAIDLLIEKLAEIKKEI